ncbi:MerR HTH family regulatory protein [Peptoclostridium litorale DSM 5388]|uniref:HTH merR-type domain-containing protein n=1 Tax=Peptoclostridium litorale DSM 5388 TaxID=1121324 RepID=A0A069REE7_PEPLI|nr:MATE family efflux transporter [Peptoclostridium litorale]KDR95113.1 hypothetical protein CLIT_11c01420 [Peptoclostridium litorale DSM 5388]SIN74810.1 MerR HTH family regulatory protein [Peptoclostridium litorale DSM 5388]
MEKYFSIEETAKINNVSIQALRLYDRMGLLKPADVDPKSNYRYYTMDQFMYIDLIKYSRQIGAPLKELGKVLEENDIETLLSFIKKQHEVVEKEIGRLQKISRAVESIEGKIEYALGIENVGDIYFRGIEKRNIIDIELGKKDEKSDVEIKLRSLDKILEENKIMFEGESGHSINELIRILKTGMPEFIVQISPAVSIFAFNQVIIKRIGEMGIAGFSIIGYISTVLLALFMGISHGIQPLLSYNYGKRDFEKADKVFEMGMKSNFAASLIIYLVILLGGDNIIAIFGGDKSLVKFTYDAIVIYAFSFVIASINIVTVTYYQSTENSKMANIISASRGIVFTLFFLTVMPLFIGDIGIWVSIILSEASTLTLIACLRCRKTLQNDMKYGSGDNMKEFIS